MPSRTDFLEGAVDLNFVRLVFTLKLEKECTDPYALFDLRPHFQEAFRQLVGCCQPPVRPLLKGETLSLPSDVCPASERRPSCPRRTYQKPSLPFSVRYPRSPGASQQGMYSGDFCSP